MKANQKNAFLGLGEFSGMPIFRWRRASKMLAFQDNMNRHQLWTLFKLRGKLTFRQYTSEPGRIVGAVIGAIVLIPLTIAAAIGSGIGYFQLPGGLPAQLLGGVLVILWGIWLIAPLLSYTINNDIDLTRLLVYPVSKRDLATFFLLGTTYDFATYLLLAMFIPIIIGWGLGLTLPIVLIALFLAYGNMVLMGQLLIVVGGGILENRRVRDASMVLLAIGGSSCYLFQNAFITLFDNFQPEDLTRADLIAWQPLNYLQWLPPGASARAIERASVGEWLSALVWLGYAGIFLILTATLWSRLLLRWLTGEGFLINIGSTAEKNVEKQAKSNPVLGMISRLFPSDMWHIFLKELRSMWRYPNRRIGVIQMMLMPALFGGFGVYQLSRGTDLASIDPRYSLIAIAFFGIFVYWVGGQNMLGYESRGLPMLLLSPVPRATIFRGKGLAIWFASLGGIIITTVLTIVATPSLWAVGAFLVVLSMGLALMGSHAILSVFFPIPLNLENMKQQRRKMTGGSFLTGLAMGTVVPMITMVTAVPAFAPFAIVAIFNWWLLAIPTILWSAVYGVVLFWFGTKYAGIFLIPREPQVMQATKPTYRER